MKEQYGKKKYYFVETDVSSEKSVEQSFLLLQKYYMINASPNFIAAVVNCAGVPDCNLELINSDTL